MQRNVCMWKSGKQEFAEVGSLLKPRWLWELNSGSQAQQQVPYSLMVSASPTFFLLRFLYLLYVYEHSIDFMPEEDINQIM